MTRLTDVLKRRRSIYALNRQLPVSEDEVLDLIKEATELVPDAFNMKSQRVIVVLGISRIPSGMVSMMHLAVKWPEKRSTVSRRLMAPFCTSLMTIP